MEVYLFDHEYSKKDPESCAWHVALSKAFAHLKKESLRGNIPPKEHFTYLKASALVFVHSQYEPLWRKRAQENHVLCHIVLVRSGGKQRDEKNKKGNLHGCSWPPSYFKTPSDGTIISEVRKFVEQVSNYDADRIDWSLLQKESTDRAEYLTALFILCQGYLAVCAEFQDPKKWNQTDIEPALKQMGWTDGFLRKMSQKPAFPSQEDVDTVMQAIWWLKPFVNESTSKVSEKELCAKALSQLREKVTKEWADHPAEVKNLLKLIDGKTVGKPKIVAEAYYAIARKLGG